MMVMAFMFHVYSCNLRPSLGAVIVATCCYFAAMTLLADLLLLPYLLL